MLSRRGPARPTPLIEGERFRQNHKWKIRRPYVVTYSVERFLTVDATDEADARRRAWNELTKGGTKVGESGPTIIEAEEV